MAYISTNWSNTHADPLLGSRWAQMWVHMWVHLLVIFAGISYQSNTHTPKVYANTKPKSLHNNNGQGEMTNGNKVTSLHCDA